MSSGPEPLPAGTIAATNVRPAFEVSLQFGATEAEIERATGLSRAILESDTATVPALATYRHLELMFAKPSFDHFIVAAAASHTPRSLGVVGLAAKTASTVEAAMRCHHRFQHLTNRTATYASERKDGRFELRETRPGEPRLGLLLTADYAMLIAVQLLRDLARGDATPIAMRSRRTEMAADERATYEAFIGAALQLGASQAALVMPEHVGDLLDSTRHRLALGYLADPALTLGEVAYLVGYREQASFFRAFRRWTGETPTAHRQRKA